MVDTENKLSMAAHAFTNLPAHLNSALNPIFYGFFNTKLKEGYKYFLNKISLNILFKSKSKSKSRSISMNEHSIITNKTNNHSISLKINTTIN